MLGVYPELVGNLVPILPESPVGVGAEWDVTQFLRYQGMRYQKTTTYTLLESDGDRLRLRLRDDYTAPKQGMDVMGESGSGPTLMRFSGAGEGELSVSLSLSLPRSSSMKGVLRIEATGKSDGKEESGTVEKQYAATVSRP
jgi:hypothetical protein